MKKETRKWIAGTLLCTMAFSAIPAYTFGSEIIAKAEAVEKGTEDAVFAVERVSVCYPYTFPMSEHLEAGIDWKDCTFGTSDSSVAIVNEAGLVIPLSNGEVEITVTTKDGKKDSCPFRVIDNENVAFLLEDGYKKIGTITGPIPEEGRNEKIHKSSVLRISSTINEGYQVRSIAANAFENADHLKEVVLPESYVCVGSKAFANCKNLKTVIVPDMDTIFEADVFDGDEIVLKGYKGSEAEKYAKQYDNITFEILDTKKDNYAPYEEAIYFSTDNGLIEKMVSISAGANENLYPAVASLNYGVKDITYTSEDSNIVSVKDGVVTGKKAGTTTITASLPSGVEKVIDVTVEGNAVSKENETMETTGSIQKETQAQDVTAVQEKQVTVQEQTQTPEVAPQKETQEPKKDIYALEQYVETPKLQITAKKTKIKVGKSYRFKAVAVNTEETIQWTVSNRKVASINKTTGKMKAKKAGKVTVKVTCGNIEKKFKVTVKK